MMRWAGAVAVLLAATLSGCVSDLLGPDKVDYGSAKKLPPLDIPPDLTAPARDDRYQIPDVNQAGATTYSAYSAERTGGPKPGSTNILPDVDNVRLERSGSERWLVVPEAPEKVWPIVKEFWQESGFLIKTENPETGVMETEWAENRAKIPEDGIRGLVGKVFDSAYSTAERDKFRTRLEHTADGKGTEIYISHRGMEEVFTSAHDVAGGTDQTAWQARPSDPGLEAEFLRRLMVRLGVQEEKAKVLAATGQDKQRAEIRKGGDGSETLQVFEPFDRAWRRVGLALDRVGFTVEDRDRQKGLYFVRYADPEKEMDTKDRDTSILGKLFGKSRDKVKPEQYRVLVKQAQEQSQVSVLNKDGAAENSSTTQRILALLHEQLK